MGHRVCVEAEVRLTDGVGVQAVPQCTVTQGSQCTTDFATIKPLWQTTRVFYSTATDGFQQAVLALNEGAFLANGNYPVGLQVLNPQP